VASKTELELPIAIDRTSKESIQRQLTAALRRAIEQGQFPAGSRLPSTRAVAAALGISRNVVLVAFEELYAEGYLEGRIGSGTYVSGAIPEPRPAASLPVANSRRLPRETIQTPVNQPAPAGAIAFRLGVPHGVGPSRDAWRRVWRSVADELPESGYSSPAGIERLRAEIAAYLGRSRGVSCTPDDLVITTGASQAISLLVHATTDPGERIAIEEPGYPTARNIFHLRNAEIVPIPVDDDGLLVDKLPTGDAAPALVYVTPSHQYPLGVRMSIARRLALMEWAEANDSLIVEDDYDGEFRYDAAPLPALAGLDRSGRVAYIGTFSKVVIPGLRIGYLLVSSPVRERILALKRLTDHHTPWSEQVAMAAFCESGDLERHIRRMRRYYANNRSVLAAELAPLGDLGRLLGLDAGLHAYLELRPDIDPEKVAERCAARGVIVSTLSDYYVAKRYRNGLLLGYGGLEPDQIVAGVRILVDAIKGFDATTAGVRK
jgi:GntR family transcriptional regulator/MocR family aminotransferase